MLWDNILAVVKKRVSSQNFDIWFRPTSQFGEDREKGKLLVQVPNKHFKYWLAEKYAEVIDASLSELEVEDVEISYMVSGEKVAPNPGVQQRAWRDGLRDPTPWSRHCVKDRHVSYLLWGSSPCPDRR